MQNRNAFVSTIQEWTATRLARADAGGELFARLDSVARHE
jgi:hypothetical protein